MLEDALNLILKWNDYHAKYIYGEVVPALDIVKQGPIKKLNKDFCVRQSHLESDYRKLSFMNFYTSDGFEIVLKDFKNVFSDVLTLKELKSVNQVFLKSVFHELYQKDKKLKYSI